MADRNPLDYYKRSYRAGGEKEGKRADEAWGRLQSFDPYASIEKAAGAQWNTFSEQLGENLADLRGSQVGMGRLTTGFGFEDQDRFTRDSLDRFYNTLASQAYRVPQYELQNNQMMASSLDREWDIKTGGADILIAEEDRKAAERMAKWQAAGQAAGGLLGALNPFSLFSGR